MVTPNEKGGMTMLGFVIQIFVVVSIVVGVFALARLFEGSWLK